MAKEEGDFDNFTYVNENNLSAIEQAQNSMMQRPQTELNLKSSFLKESFAIEATETTAAA